MVHLSYTAAVDLPFAGNLGLAGPSHDLQHQRYATPHVLSAY
jgi:hypothetical protein